MVGAWTLGDVLGHMTRGVTAAHPPPVRRMITQAVSKVSAYYGTAPPLQLLYGDGPGIFSVNARDISAIIEWGGVRAGRVAGRGLAVAAVVRCLVPPDVAANGDPGNDGAPARARRTRDAQGTGTCQRRAGRGTGAATGERAGRATG